LAKAKPEPVDRQRRGLLTGGAALAGGLLANGRSASADTSAPSAIPDWTKTQGAPVDSPPYGVPSPFEKSIVRRPRDNAKFLFPTAANSVTPLQDLQGIITPSGLHYERHHAGVPAIDPGQHRLLIHGLVERPLILSMEDITRYPSVSRLHFLECSGNTIGWTNAKKEWTAQDSHGLLSCSEWTGVPLSTVLAEVGVKPRAKWVLAEGADAAAVTRSIPIEKALDDAILAYAQNGERLRPEQGYPLRLFLPGFEGNMSVKWLRRLKLGDQPYFTREETSKYTGLLPDGKAVSFNFIMEVKSVITQPSGGQQLREPGFHEISGLAWSGQGRVRRVDVSTDGGATWREARLQEPVLTKCLTRFRLPWTWDGGPALLQSRATDEFGNVQPTHDALVAKRGTNFYYHYNGIQTWRIEASGALFNAV
jgi:sulfane dehydrogenase subunit SoxC